MPQLIFAGLSEHAISLLDKHDLTEKKFTLEISKLIISSIVSTKTEFGTGIIDDKRLNEMITFYKTTNPNGILELNVPQSIINDFLTNIYWIEKTGFKRGIYAYLNKSSKEAPGFNILLHPMYYKNPLNGHPINHIYDELLKDKNEFLLNVETSKIIKSNIDCTDELLKYPEDDKDNDSDPVKEAFIPFDDLLNGFISKLETGPNIYDTMKFQFARNAPQGRITFAISCWINDKITGLPIRLLNSEIVKDGTHYSGMLLDDHDLIPPPPDNS